MIKKYLHQLGLDLNTTISDVKKLYRVQAKINHPDKFSDPDEKIKQSKIMADITEAYEYILINSEKICSREKSEIKQTPSDYRMYKLGLTYYNKYFDTFFKMFSKRELYNPEEKKICLKKAKEYFTRLLKEFPESEWALDSKDKIKKIDDAIKTLN